MEEEHELLNVCPHHRAVYGIRWRTGKSVCTVPATNPPRDDNRKKHGNIEPKKARQDEEHGSITEKIDKSKNSIGLLQAHLDKGTCPKSLRYNVKANIMPDEDFKSDVSSIRKRA